MPNSYAENLINSNEKEEFESEKLGQVKLNKEKANGLLFHQNNILLFSDFIVNRNFIKIFLNSL